MSKDQTTTAVAQPWKPAQQDLQNVLTEVQNLYYGAPIAGTPAPRQGGGFFGGFGGRGQYTGERGPSGMPQAYTGDRVAGFSPQTIAALQALETGSGLADPSIANLTQLMSGDNMYRDFDTIRGMVADDVKSQLGSTFSGGAVNSSLAQDTYTRALGEALAGVEYGAYNDAQNRRLSAIGMAPSIAGLQMDEEKAALVGGSIYDDMAQRELDAEMAEYRELENQDLNALKEYANIAMGVGGMGGTKSETQPVSIFSGLGGVGDFASGIGGLIGAFCDARLKTDIRLVGHTPKGTPLYNFRYLWSPQRFIGPIAQEVPKAIVGTVGGFFVINPALVD